MRPAPVPVAEAARSEQARETRETVSARILVYPTGWRAVVLAIGEDLPCPWVAIHLLDLTLRGLKVRTIRNRALALARLLLFCKARSINYIQRCRGIILSDLELADLAGHMRGTASTPRVSAASEYSAAMAFLCATAVRLRPPDDPSVRLEVKAFESAAKRHQPRSVKPHTPPRLGLTDDQRAAFLTAVLPDPDSTDPLELRNYVLMMTAYALGMRTGELLGLKVCDLNLRVWPAQVSIVERVADPEEPRVLPAMAKTGGRDLPLSHALSLAYQQLMDDRPELPHGFVFVNRYGAPLSERGLRRIYQDLGHRHPELENLCNHMLRHDWNDRWNRMVAKEGWDPNDSVRHQRHTMGWSADSPMPTHYGRRSIQELAKARHLRLQEEDIIRSMKVQS